ncbi:polysaccharide lyase family 7 protein [Lentzea nigeriaca]|uniref:polysaccharide lyase family 7 protein n=1 Tax=Lentzea nigeriaca TaxID=1128665 RepID=UPI001EF99E34|nr:polysaccharide lyase family 7 protein [Lentzea nigeriaca]MBM7862226.1 hypothetical protein [Lentzea nigeriaca]
MGVRKGLAAATAVALLPVAAMAADAAERSAPTLPVTAVTASGDDGNVPANTLDGNLETRWSAKGDGAWISFDLGAPQTVSAVSIAWHRGDQRTATFDLQTSADGSTWAPAAEGLTSRRTLAQVAYDIPDAEARYVRIVGHGNSSGNGWNSITEVDVLAPGGDPAPCERPAQVLDLRNWKITLPVDDPDKEGAQPREITQPKLDGFAQDPWFVTDEGCKGVRFRAPVNGVTTQNSKNPRSELREMTDDGTRLASWSSTSGKHTMVVEQAVTELPKERPYVVVGQIHDSSDDVTVFRLEGAKLYLTNGDNSRYKLIDDDYRLGTRFQAKFEVSDGRIRAYYNDRLVDTITTSFTGGYFKAGAYTQANCGNSAPCDASNFGQVTIYKLTVTHR